MKKFAEYILCLGCVAVAGYLGASLFHPGVGYAAQDQNGEKLYKTNCESCHPGAGDIAGSAHLKTLEAFTKFNRNPVKPDGSKGNMPAYPKDKISDEEMKLLYDYTKSLTAKP